LQDFAGFQLEMNTDALKIMDDLDGGTQKSGDTQRWGLHIAWHEYSEVEAGYSICFLRIHKRRGEISFDRQ
jgi:hypothetical protein